uniref:Myomesin 2 n=1 Tax=Nothobranchius furzeri TaxID=105023 RepID=A0A8C6KV60_NOTFU
SIRLIEGVRTKMVEKYVREEPMVRGPQFIIRLRSHTVFENTPIKLFCTVEGFPMPVVKWYRDGVIMDLSSGRYLIEAKGGSHSLMIPRCSTDDTAQYTAVAGNSHGQASSQASIIVKRYKDEEESSPYAWLPFTGRHENIHYTKINITFVEKFGPVFATEGESATLSATMTLNPNLANLQPEAQWYRDDTRLFDSKWVKIETGRGITTLTLPNLYKDDEGLYTLRMVTKGGTAEHSAFVSVADGPPPVARAPGAPMDIKIHDANRDYVIVSWKPPNTTTEGPIIGYFVDKCEVGTENWTQCNDHPIKICKYPVSGLFEGHSFYFRVRAVNSSGISKPSRMSDPIAAMDPTELERLHAKKLGGKLDVVSYNDEVEGKPPGPPSGIHVCEIDRTYVVLSWDGPKYFGKVPMWYYIEKAWQRVNTKVPIRSTRYAVFDLAEGKEYKFRVLSANMYGASAPSQPSGLVETLQLKGVPSAPGQVVATRETDTSLLIQWAPPKEPNNLIGYYIDQCVKGTNNWTSANHKPHKSTKFVVSGLTTGETYIFRVQAINELGLSDESQESAPLSVRAALTNPSAPYDIALLNCDGRSMVLNWKKPLHSGGTEIKEYYVDKRRSGTTMWREIHIPPVTERLYKVEGLTEGAVYQFHVYAANLAGLGPASKHSDDFTCKAWTMPEPGPAYDLTFCEVRDSSVVLEWNKPIYTGSGPITGYHVEYAETGSSVWITANETAVSNRFLKEISCVVDEKSGDIILSFESCQLDESSQFIWKKDYKEITHFSKGLTIKTEGSHSKLIFKNPDKEDIGTYSVSVTNTSGVSSSYTISAEELEKMLALSYDIRHPIIPLKSELAYKILERGRMRFWLQAEEISSNVTYKFFANNKELSGMGHNVSTGIIEFIMDHFTEENEGTFTCQITDGGGKAQSSLVLIGDGRKETRFHCLACTSNLLLQVVQQKMVFNFDFRCAPSSPLGASAEELVIKCTWFYDVKTPLPGCVHWFIDSQVVEPTDKDKGLYSIVITNSENSHKRTLDLSGDGESPLRIIVNCCHYNRGKVVGGLPDVVTIMEKKTLSLTCTVCGDPKPQVSWLKNGADVEPDDQYVVSIDQGKFASLTIKGVSMEDSGRYAMIVQNKYGGESVDIVVSVSVVYHKLQDLLKAMKMFRLSAAPILSVLCLTLCYLVFIAATDSLSQ